MRVRGAGWTGLAVAGLLAAGCYSLRLSNPDETLYLETPRDPPEERWIRGEPALAVAFDGAFRSFDEGPRVRDPNASFTYARLLRKARVFRQVGGPDISAHPESAGRVWIETHYVTDDNDVTNMAKAVIAPGLTGYRTELSGHMTLHLELPGGETLRYQARTSLARLYYASGRRDTSKQLIYREVNDTNFLALVHQLRADPRLYGGAP